MTHIITKFRCIAMPLAALLLTACGGGNNGIGSQREPGAAIARYTVSGAVSGLTGSLVLQNNGGDNITVTADGNFTFSGKFSSGSTYAVTVLTQPVSQTCSVSTGAGTVSGNNVSNVIVTCSTNSHTVGGVVSGLTGTVVLQDNNGDNLTVSANGAFTFATAVAQGSPYAVTVMLQPSGQNCSVANGTGTIAGANISNVAIACAANMFTVGGTVSGLSGTVVLQNNSGDNLTISTNGNFTFASAISDGGAYTVTVLTQPTGQTCSVSTGAGTVSGNNVSNVAVTCSVNAYTVGGSVSGLTGTVVLQNNSGDNLSITANGNFTFPATVAYGSPYNVTVLTQPTGQSCSIANGTGTIPATNVSNVAITCATNTHTVGGVVSGLNGSMVLQNNGADNLTVATNGAFTFPAAVSYNNPYSVTLLSLQFPGQNCVISNGSGTVTGNVSNVVVACTTPAAPTASAVTITGTAQVGQTLSGNYTYADANGDPQGTSTFRWLRNGAAIAGATASTYILVSADQGTQISFEVTPVATVAPFTGAAVTSAATTTVTGVGAPAAPSASAVTISGTTQVGQVLTGSYTYTDVNNDPQGISTFRWLRNGAAIAGATAMTYTLVSADQGTQISFEVTPVATVAPITGTPVVSAATTSISPAPTAPSASNVTISGTAQVGQTLTGSYTYADVNGDPQGTSTFRWLRNGVAIAGATANTYTLVTADWDTTISFEVTPVSTVAPTTGTPVSGTRANPLPTGYVVQGGLTWSPNNLAPQAISIPGATNAATGLGMVLWTSANTFCTTGAFTGWRLPTQPELSALDSSPQALAGALASNKGWAANITWSSTPSTVVAGGYRAVYLVGDPAFYNAFADGTSNADYVYVSCVR